MLTLFLARRRPSSFVLTLLMLALVTLWLVLTIIGVHAQTAVTSPATQATPPASIPYGDWIASVLAWARDALVALAGLAVVRFLPATVRQYLTNQVLAKAVDYAIAAVEGATKGQSLSLPITSAVIAAAERYVVASAPALAAQLGPLLRAKILSRISDAAPLAPDVTAAKVGAALPAVPVK